VFVQMEMKNMVKYLIEHGADANKIDYIPLSYNGDLYLSGNTLIYHACDKVHKNIVKYLIEHGADINKENSKDETPIFKAYKKGNKSIIKYLVEHGAKKKNNNTFFFFFFFLYTF